MKVLTIELMRHSRLLSILLSSIILSLFSIILFLPSSVWSVLPDKEDDDRINNFDDTSTNLRGGTSSTYEPEKDVKVGGVDTTQTIKGESKGILIIGTNKPDFIVGKDGDDTINGLGESDVLYGDDGDDTIQGAGDADQIYGNEGNDVLMGGTEPNTNNAGDSDANDNDDSDFLSGGDGNDELYGGDGDDTLKGGDGKDLFNCGLGTDTVYDFDKSEGDSYGSNCEIIIKK